jgi:uncharacterized protein YkwD
MKGSNSIKKTVGTVLALTLVTASISTAFASVKLSTAGKEISVSENGIVVVNKKDTGYDFSIDKLDAVGDIYRNKIKEKLQSLKSNVSGIKGKVDEFKNYILDKAYTWHVGDDESAGNTESTTVTTETATESTTVTTTTVTTATTTEAVTETTTGTTTEATYSDYVLAVVNATNAEREKNNLPKLVINDALCSAAQAHAEDMNANDYFDHTSLNGDTAFDRMRKYTTKFSYLGENIAYGLTDGEAAVNSWMNSDGHRANILNEHYTEIGVGYKDGYWVQDFGG